jgi:hypothetical protein
MALATTGSRGWRAMPRGCPDERDRFGWRRGFRRRRRFGDRMAALLGPGPISGIDGRCSAGEHWPEALLERRTGKRTDDPVDLVPVADHD